MGKQVYPGVLYEDEQTQTVLLYLVEKLAATVLNVASDTRIEPDRANQILSLLESAGLVRLTGPLREPYGGVYSPTEAGLRAGRAIRSWASAS
jgi:hypothetical protein